MRRDPEDLAGPRQQILKSFRGAIDSTPGIHLNFRDRLVPDGREDCQPLEEACLLQSGKPG